MVIKSKYSIRGIMVGLLMKRVTVTVAEEVDLKFKKEASKRFKFERGWYSAAVNEAMKAWLSEDPSFDGQNFPRQLGKYLWINFRKKFDVHQMEPNECMNLLIEYIYGENHPIFYEISNDDVIINFSGIPEPENLEHHLLKMFQLITVVRAAQEDHKGSKYSISGLEEVKKIVISKE